MTTLANFVLFTSVTMYVFALLGMALFAGKLRFEVAHPDYIGLCVANSTSGVIDNCEDGVRMSSARMNFDNLGNAFLTIFTVMLARDWHIIFYDCIRAVGLVWSICFRLGP